MRSTKSPDKKNYLVKGHHIYRNVKLKRGYVIKCIIHDRYYSDV